MKPFQITIMHYIAVVGRVIQINSRCITESLDFTLNHSMHVLQITLLVGKLLIIRQHGRRNVFDFLHVSHLYCRKTHLQ